MGAFVIILERLLRNLSKSGTFLMSKTPILGKIKEKKRTRTTKWSKTNF